MQYWHDTRVLNIHHHMGVTPLPPPLGLLLGSMHDFVHFGIDCQTLFWNTKIFHPWVQQVFSFVVFYNFKAHINLLAHRLLQCGILYSCIFFFIINKKSSVRPRKNKTKQTNKTGSYRPHRPYFSHLLISFFFFFFWQRKL